MADDVLDRILARAKALNKAPATVSRAAGLSPDAIRNAQRSVKAGKGTGFTLRTLEQLARELDVPLAWLIAGDHADAAPAPTVEPGEPSFSDVTSITFDPARGPATDGRQAAIAAAFGRQHQVDPQRVETDCLNLDGVMPHDTILVDYRHPEDATEGDTVVAQVMQPETGEWFTALRRIRDRFLVPSSTNPAHRPFLIGEQTQIRGIVVARWAMLRPDVVIDLAPVPIPAE